MTVLSQQGPAQPSCRCRLGSGLTRRRPPASTDLRLVVLTGRNDVGGRDRVMVHVRGLRSG